MAAGRKGRYWNDEVTVNNNANPTSPNPWRGALTIFTAKRGSPDVYRSESRMAEIAARLQTFAYDFDGNLTSDGVMDYQWDAENRLIRVETTFTARSWGYPHRLLEFRYDYLGRRVQKRAIDGAASTEVSCRRYLYDGWNLMAEYAAPGGSFCGALLRSYTWGLDIVSTLADAGGVGALLQIADHPSGKTYLPAYDGNGNIAALFNASTGALAAAYEFGPFGEPLRTQTLDATVADNPFRFSTKFTDVETGLVYYEHRYYDPKNGRFINRDPIEESGGLNLYGFCGNNAINRWDVLGQDVRETEYGTYWATATDVNGVVREWNFGNRDDAERWAAAWEKEDYDLLRPYIHQMAEEAAAKQTAAAERWVTTTIQLNIGILGSLHQHFFPSTVPGADDDDAMLYDLLSYIDPFTLYFTIQERLGPICRVPIQFFQMVGTPQGATVKSLQPTAQQMANWNNALFDLRQYGALGAAMFNRITTSGLVVVQTPEWDPIPWGTDFSGINRGEPEVGVNLNFTNLMDRDRIVRESRLKGYPNLENQLSRSGAIVLGHELGHALLGINDEFANTAAVENMLRSSVCEARRDYYRSYAVPQSVSAQTQLAIDRFILKWTPGL